MADPIRIMGHDATEGIQAQVGTDKALYVNLKSADVTGYVPIRQDVEADTNNSSTTNLAVGNSYTFTGTKTSTLGIAGIQVSLFADKNCIIKVQQSPEGTNWDLIDTYYYTASGNFGITVQAISSYVRIVVTTNNETTTKFRLQTALCPIVEAVPRSLDGNGNFKIASPVDEYGFGVENTPIGEMRVVEPTRLVGAIFDGSTVDSNFWTATVSTTGSDDGTVTQGSGEVTLSSGKGAATFSKFNSLRRARYVSANALRYRAVIQLGDTGTENNTRKWGVAWGSSMPTITDGAYFQLSGTEFSIVTLKGGNATKVTSFNGRLGATYSLDTSAKTYEIYWTNSRVWFIIGGELLHTVSATSTTWAATVSHHIYIDNVNSNTQAEALTIKCRVASISRLGKYETQPIYYRISGNAATHTLKLGAGILHKIIFNNTSGTSITIVDNVTGTTPVIGVITTATAALGSWDYSCPFNTGLILITAGNSLDATIVYE